MGRGSLEYAELACQSAFSFREGASLPEELVGEARRLGLKGLCIADRAGVYGLVRAWKAAKQVDLPLLHGALMRMAGLPEVTLVAQTTLGWANLCKLVTQAGKDRPKGQGALPLDALAERATHVVALAGPEWVHHPREAGHLADLFGDRLYWMASRHLRPDDGARVQAAESLSRRFRRPVVATGRVLAHCAERKPLQDVLTCIREKVTLDAAGRLLESNGERYLKGPATMAALFPDHVAWVRRTVEVSERCHFHLGHLAYRYPQEVVPAGHTPMSWLRHLVEGGARRRWPEGVPSAVADQLEHELGVIEELDFPAYFLTVEDVVRMARALGILCQGRGSAANSAVCYVLGITAVDPARSRLLFERFISKERGEPPDIDVDFEHERREEVIQAVYEKYGRDRAAMVNEVISYRARSAVRDVGKVFGLSLEQVDHMARAIDGWSSQGPKPEEVREAGLDPDDTRVRHTITFCRALHGFPRHVSIHVGGFVIAEGSLEERCPIEPATMEGRTVIQWDKDDVDAVGFVKVDLLALGMLTAIRKCFELVAAHHGRALELATVPAEDPAVYDMIGRAETIGVFQIESRAQQSMLPRLRPRNFYDLVIEVSIVRPGPIQGGMVHPYLDRRSGKEPVTYAHPALVPILERTLGVPIFQEQVMEMAMAVGGFTAGEADQLRRAMGAWRKRGGLEPLVQRLLGNLQRSGLDPAWSEQIAKQIMGFGEYGFPESHAASFALLVYVSCWLRLYTPAAFTAALLNSQPMGFYSPSSLLADARRSGVELRPVCVRRSAWDYTLEPDGAVDPRLGGHDGVPSRGVAIRVGLRQVHGLGEEEGRRIEAARAEGPLRSVADLARRAHLDRGALRALARANAFAEAFPEPLRRREGVWQVEGLWSSDTPLLVGLPGPDEGAELLPRASAVHDLQQDYRATSVSLTAHPVGLMRGWLTRRRVVTVGELVGLPADGAVRVAGLVTHRQRPQTASGVVFMSLEDETGIANLVVWPRVFARQRRVARGENLVIVSGRLQRENEALSIVAFRFERLPLELAEKDEAVRERGVELPTRSRDFR